MATNCGVVGGRRSGGGGGQSHNGGVDHGVGAIDVRRKPTAGSGQTGKKDHRRCSHVLGRRDG